MRSRLFCAVLWSSVFSIHAAPAVAQTDSAATISVIDTPRPVAFATKELAHRHGWPISYEDQRYEFEGELELPPPFIPGSTEEPKGKRPLRLSRTTFSVTYSLSASPKQVLQQVVDQYARTSGNVFEVKEIGGRLVVMVAKARDRSGQVVSQTPLLSTPISLAAMERSGTETLREICKQLRMATGEKVVEGTGPLNAFVRSRLTLSAVNEPARDVLIRLIDSVLGNRWVWNVNHGPGYGYAINFDQIVAPADNQKNDNQKDSANHQVFTSSEYGVSFAYPNSYRFEPERNATHCSTTAFTNNEREVVLGTVVIPRSLYDGTNFRGGAFLVSVSPNITNSAACDQFASGRPGDKVSINGTPYSASSREGVAMGHYLHADIFHTYQHGFCYEFMVEMNIYNRANLEDPSSVQEFSDDKKIKNDLLSGISFFQPKAKPSVTKDTPAILSFSASSLTAGAGVHNGITFSWTTHGVDYVQFRYSCPKGVVVVEGSSAPCQESSASSPPPNRSPNASATILFGNRMSTSPERPSIPVTVTLVPFANGVECPKLSKSVVVTVSPYDAFPDGVPTSNRNMTVTLSPPAPNGELSFARGATVSIAWVDTSTHPPAAPCVNLYLVRDDERGGETYLYSVADRCLKPGSGGSYQWTIPNTFSGSGFRILGAAPGGRANALSTPFTIN